MNWRQQLKEYEDTKEWKLAIELMQKTINDIPGDLDAYLSMNYLLMNLLVEENYDNSKHDYYVGLLKKYFLESYSKFSHNPEYLFYIGQIACISEWYFDLETVEAQAMIKEAAYLEPKNILYKWADFIGLDMRNSINRGKMIYYAREVLSDSSVKKILKEKGALGEYLLNGLEYWSKKEITT